MSAVISAVAGSETVDEALEVYQRHLLLFHLVNSATFLEPRIKEK